VGSAAQLAAFMRFVLGNVALEVGRHHGWNGRFWGRRYRSIVVADGASQVARLRYILANGCKEGLVERPQDWPGVSCARALTVGDRLRGTWYDRTAEYEARRRGRKPDPRTTAIPTEVKLSPLPTWSHLHPKEYRAAICDLVRTVEVDSRRARVADQKTAVLGVRGVLLQKPHSAPAVTDRRPAPLVHAIGRSVRLQFMAAYRAFVDAYRSAAKALRAGSGDALFPENAFPSPAPFRQPAFSAPTG
jgi:hypothetical protein